MKPVLNLVPLFVILPFAGAFLASVVGRRFAKLPGVLTVLASFALCVNAVVTISHVASLEVMVYSVGAWKAPVGIAMVVDGFSAFMLVTVNTVASAIALYSLNYVCRYTAEWKFYTLFLLMLGGMNGVIVSGDIFNLYVFLEIASLASFALVAFDTGRHALEAAFKYAIMSAVGSLFVLLSIVFLYSYTSTLNMADIANTLMQKPDSTLMVMVSVLFLMGFGLKSALVPFHAWLPDAHPAAPAPISAMLSGVLIKSLGIYTLSRVFFNIIGMTSDVASILMFLSALSMVVGGFLAIGQWDFKRLLACSSVSQMGYIVFALSLGTPLGVMAGLFHLFNHSMIKSLLFLNSGAVEYATGTRDLQKLGGLMSKMPVTGMTNVAGAMAISGVPPFNGFWSKLLILLAAVQAGEYGYALCGVLASLLTLGAVLKVIKHVFRGVLPEAYRDVREVPFFMKLSMSFLALVCLVGGVVFLSAGLNDMLLAQASRVILKGVNYGRDVLSHL